MDRDEWERQRDAAYRAIGRYMVAFSHLVYLLRYMVVWRLTSPDPDLYLGELVIGLATAQPISDSFFAMCRYLGELDESEQNIANQLQTDVNGKIATRNKIAHGDWWVGELAERDAQTIDAAELVRVHPSARSGDFRKVERYSADDLDAESERLFELGKLLADFGFCALQLPMRIIDHQPLQRGSYRVSDVLVAENVPRSGKGGTITRGGPRSADIQQAPTLDGVNAWFFRQRPASSGSNLTRSD